jgi:hypothetical protein
MANYHNLLSKTDRALVAYLVAQEAGTVADVLPAKRSQDRTLPATVCFSNRGQEAAPYSGTYVVSASIIVRSPGAVELNAAANDARLASEERVAQTFDAFHKDIDSAGDKLADDITAAARALAIADPDNNGDLADFTVLDVVIKGIDAGVEEGTVVWTDTLELELVCCPSNVSDQ